MAATLAELLSPSIILDVISRVKRMRGPIGSWLGFHGDRFDENSVSINGPNTMRAPGDSLRSYRYNIFDYTRVPMKLRAPGVGAGTVAQNPMGTNTVTMARFHQKIPLSYEFLGQLAPMIGPMSKIDQGGQDYIMRQTQFLAAQGNNVVEMLAVGMLRDSLYFYQVGDNWYPSFTVPASSATPYVQLNYQIPAGNKSQLNMLGTGNIIQISWDNQAAPIIKNLQQIISAYAQLSAFTLTDVWINSIMWYYIITNTEVRNLAGSAASPFAAFDREKESGMRDSGPPSYYGVLKGQPTIKWHFADGGLVFGSDIDISYASVPTGSVPAGATFNKLLPDTMAIFCTEPSSEWTRFVVGGEYISENVGQTAQLRMGWHAWKMFTADPSMVMLMALLNGVPALFIPKVVAPATVVF